MVAFAVLGRPSVFVASSAFDTAARAQARALHTSVRWVTVPHPIQNRTDVEMRALADGAVDALIGALAEGSARRND